MYCMQCGVKLAESEKCCPLCGLEAYHPQLKKQEGRPLYPDRLQPEREVSPWGLHFIILTAFLIPLITVLICDFSLFGGITWSGYVVGALVLLYVSAVLPFWFKNPNPVIFVPIDFAVVTVYLLYIDLVTPGSWFMSFAFPVTGFLMVLVSAVVTLMRYVRRGRFFIFGGATMLLGLFMPVMELLLYITFDVIVFTGWSFYPMGALALFGGFLIFLGICRPARETMARKFFI